jgi:lipopolysaccharide export system protein LptC
MDHMTISRGEEQGAHGFLATRPADNARAFRFAARHSRHVRILRIAIPIGVVLCLLVIVAATFLNPFRLLKLPKDFGALVISGSKITMEQPRLSGFTRDSRAYELTARAAAQDLSKPDQVELKEIRAKIDMQDKSTMQMSAAGGIYDTKSEMLTLGPDILLSSSTGYEGRLSEALIDIRKGNIVSNKPVEVKMLKGDLNANRLEVTDAGDLVRFDGGVRMTVKLEPGDYPQAGAVQSDNAKAGTRP